MDKINEEQFKYSSEKGREKLLLDKINELVEESKIANGQ